jgi:hypothetical protein
MYTNEQKSMLRHTVSMLSGFCAEEGPEEFLKQIFAAVLEGEAAKAMELAEEASSWVLEWERKMEE